MIILLSVVQRYSLKLSNGRVISGNDMYSVSAFVALTLVMALRAKSVGVDTAAYSRIFTRIASYDSFLYGLSHDALNGPVYIAICRVLSMISRDPQILTVFTALFINIGLYIFIKRTTEDHAAAYIAWIGLTLFYCSMNGSRQCMALVMVINALDMLSKNLKDAKAWTLCLLAAGIHATAIFALIAVLGIIAVKRVADKKKLFAGSLMFGAVFAFTYKGAVMLILKLIPGYAIYTASNAAYNIFEGSGGGRIVLLYLFLMAVLMLWLWLDMAEAEKDTDKPLFCDFFMPAVTFALAFGIINCRNELVNRMLWYYLALLIPFIPSVADKYGRNAGMLIKSGILAVLIVYSLLSLIENQNGIVPYVAFWNFI